jgi:hypothetical protein
MEAEATAEAEVEAEVEAADAGKKVPAEVYTRRNGMRGNLVHNERMRVARTLGWGIVIYAVMYLVWTGFILYGFVGGLAPRLLGLLVLVVLATIAARSLRFASARDVLPYSLSWVLVVILLDAVFSVPYAGWQLYTDWNVWVGYTLVVLVPLLAPYTRPRTQ